MSLVSSFVRMSNNKLYKNPTIYDDTNEWFLCFDDDDPPEIVVKTHGQLSKINRKDKIINLLQKHKINAIVSLHEVSGQRLFPPDWNNFHNAIRAFLKIKQNIDISELKVKHDGIHNDIPSQPCVVYDFNFC